MITINAILMEPGKDPVICKLPADIDQQLEKMSDILDGNFASSRLFYVGNGISLHIFVNDLAIPLGLTANRHFPEPDEKEIVYGNALLLAIEDATGGENGALDIPEDICALFIEKLKENLLSCNGDEKPEPGSDVFTENPGTDEERSFRWVEVSKPENINKFIGNGRVRLVDDGKCDIIETHGRYFQQVFVKKTDKNLQ